ncbi:MAG: TatD family nuclease-associated radical SAM protein [Oscillospiraceae bacterium]|nr:TatD family nuclease-associated radical SAM protein [Oscillospiraceae bacterium]
MIITYELGNSLYINMTNRCSNDCEFCVRNLRDDVNGQDNLWLEREPTVDEIMEDISKRDLSKYDEIVFCGFGEPMIRYDDVLNIAARLKASNSPPIIRVNTNGHGNLIAGRDITPELAGKIDVVSISLNAKNAAEYDKVCRSEYSEAAYAAMLDFAKLASKYARVILTVVDDMNAGDIEACRKIAKNLGVDFRVRTFI